MALVVEEGDKTPIKLACKLSGDTLCVCERSKVEVWTIE